MGKTDTIMLTGTSTFITTFVVTITIAIIIIIIMIIITIITIIIITIGITVGLHHKEGGILQHLQFAVGVHRKEQLLQQLRDGRIWLEMSLQAACVYPCLEIVACVVRFFAVWVCSVNVLSTCLRPLLMRFILTVASIYP